MLPVKRNYSIYPCVVRADQETEMTIVPNEKAFLLFEGEEYQLTIIDVNGDITNYYEPIGFCKLNVAAHDGVLRFSHVFEEEQEHLIILEKDEKKLQEFTVFSLDQDLYELRPLKGDLHGHSYRSDGQQDPAALAGHYREQGYEFFALTDHNRYYPGGEIDETYAGVKLGITRVRGEEVHAPGIVVHIVHVGGNHSVAEQYVSQREQYEKDCADYLTRVPETVPEKYRERYSKVVWATDRIHEAGGLAIFPHPYWRPGKSRTYNVCDEFTMLLLKSGMFDAYELVGGMGKLGNNRSVALWADLRTEGLKIPVVGSSDVHGLEKSTFMYLFTLCFARENDNDSIIEAVRNGLSVAVEATGEDYDRQNRCYGSLRLVTYAHFLLQHYYPQLQRICQGEGVAMRAYAMGHAGKELIEWQVEQSETFRRQFFGLEKPELPSKAVLEFEDKWRNIHIERGPITKGGTIDSDVITRQI